jgi:hypothetical protein
MIHQSAAHSWLHAQLLVIPCGFLGAAEARQGINAGTKPVGDAI